MDWPIFHKDNLKLGSTESQVGVCTLWTKKELVYWRLDEKNYAVCGNLYTIQGINPMIKNILANPKIKYIILCGADLMKSGDALLNLMQNGIDSERKIVGSSGIVDSKIEPALIEKFRENVKVIDMRGRETDVPKILGEIKTDGGQFMEPVWILEEDKTAAPLKTAEVAFKARGQTIAETWLRILNFVMKFGEEKESDYKIKQKEIVDMVAVVEGDDNGLAPWLTITEKDLENYYKTFFSAEKPEGVEYTYGERLMRFSLSHVPSKFLGEIEETQDQTEIVAKLLRDRPFTRRAVAFTLRDADRGLKSPPCLTQITWHIREKKLVQTAIFRSHDIFGAWVLNVFALRRLQKQIAEKIGIEVGRLVIISNSAHIYENNWGQADSILNKYHTDKIIPFIQDENGYFVVRVENGEIIVEHLTKEGLPSGFIFRGTKAQRAEICLKEGKKFVQDEA